jgi:hypothetical protein
MKSFTIITVIAFCCFALSINSCKKDENNIELSNSYSGLLLVEYTKGFPAFTSTARLGVDIMKDGTVTFSGGGDSDEFEAEDILYEDGKPATKMKMTGTLVFNGAQGEVMIADTIEYVLIKVSSSLYVQMTVWAWDDELGWMQVIDIPHTQQDKYSDGPLQFGILDASSLNGQSIKRTLPDVQGTFTYGYNLTLIPGL